MLLDATSLQVYVQLARFKSCCCGCSEMRLTDAALQSRIYTSVLSFPQWHGPRQSHLPPGHANRMAQRHHRHNGATQCATDWIQCKIKRCGRRQSSRSPGTRRIYASMSSFHQLHGLTHGLSTAAAQNCMVQRYRGRSLDTSCAAFALQSYHF